MPHQGCPLCERCPAVNPALTRPQARRLKSPGMAKLPPAPSVAEAIALMQKARARGRGRRSPIMVWMQQNREALAAAFAVNAPAWSVLATYLGERGITDGDGKRPSARTAREAWGRVKAITAATTARPEAATAPVLSVPQDSGRDAKRDEMDKPRRFRTVKLRGLEDTGKQSAAAPAKPSDPLSPEPGARRRRGPTCSGRLIRRRRGQGYCEPNLAQSEHVQGRVDPARPGRGAHCLPHPGTATVLQVQPDRKCPPPSRGWSCSACVARRKGVKVLLALKNMGGESEGGLAQHSRRPGQAVHAGVSGHDCAPSWNGRLRRYGPMCRHNAAPCTSTATGRARRVRATAGTPCNPNHYASIPSTMVTCSATACLARVSRSIGHSGAVRDSAA